MNFGLFLPLALAALVLAARERRREELLVIGPALAVFGALFLVRLAPWEWDNTKVLLWCYVAALPAIGSLVLARVGAAWRAALVFGLFFSGAVSVLGASIGRGPRLEVLNLAEYDGVCRALDGPEGDARGHRADVQPPRGAVRAADRGGLRRSPVEPRPRRRGRCSRASNG